MSESSSLQTSSRLRNHDQKGTNLPNHDRTPTHSPNLDRSPILDRPICIIFPKTLKLYITISSNKQVSKNNCSGCPVIGRKSVLCIRCGRKAKGICIEWLGSQAVCASRTAPAAIPIMGPTPSTSAPISSGRLLPERVSIPSL